MELPVIGGRRGRPAPGARLRGERPEVNMRERERERPEVNMRERERERDQRLT